MDRFGGVYVLGGWNSGGALSSCERLTHPLVSAQQQRQPGGCLGVNAETPACAPQAPVPAPAAAAAAVSPAPLERTTVGESGEPPLSAAAAAAGESDWGWEALPPLRRQRCFLGAAFEPSGALLAMGGGTGPYRNDSAFETVEVLRPGKWEDKGASIDCSGVIIVQGRERPSDAARALVDKLALGPKVLASRVFVYVCCYRCEGVLGTVFGLACLGWLLTETVLRTDYGRCSVVAVSDSEVCQCGCAGQWVPKRRPRPAANAATVPAVLPLSFPPYSAGRGYNGM